MKQKKQILRVITLTLLCATMLSGISLQAAISIVKMTGTTIPSFIYYSPGDTIEIVNDPLEAADWNVLKGLTTPYHLELPDHNQPIPASALQGHTIIHSVYAPNATSIGNDAFNGCTALNDITFSDVTSIGTWAFKDCSALTTVTFPEATSIGEYAFWNCQALTTVMFPEVTSIGNSAFWNCQALTAAIFPEVILIGNGAFERCFMLTTVTFPEATSIGNEAFKDCSTLITVMFPEVILIGNGAFQACSALTTVTFPKATSIGNEAFKACSALTMITFPEVTSIGTWTFQDCSALTTVTFPKAISIGGYAFYRCTALTTPTFPEATSIGTWTFKDCSALTTVTFPEVTSIGDLAFHDSPALLIVTFPQATSIGNRVFEGCTALTAATFPQAASFGDGVFDNCTVLETLVLGTTPPALGTSLFPGVSSLLLIVPDSVAYTPAVLADYPVGSEAFNEKVTTRLDTLISGATLTLTPDRVPGLSGGFFQWERNGTIIPGAGNAAFQAIKPGLYTLKYFRGELFVELLSTQVTGTSYDLIGIDRRYEGCDYVLQMNFLPATTDRTVEVWSQGTGVDYLFDMDSKAYLKDRPTYTLLAGDSVLTLRYSVDEETADGSQATLSYRITSGGLTETTDVYTLYARPQIELVKYHPATALYQGVLEVSIEKGSNHLLLSLNGGLTWQFARDTVTGDVLPLSQSQIANFELGSSILFREPNGCGHQTLIVGHQTGPSPGITRVVTIPAVSGMICSVSPGEYSVTSGTNFTFTIAPTGDNADKVPHVSTSRTSLPDSEGVSVTANGDGSFTVTIYRIQEPVIVTIDFSTANGAIDSSDNRVWTADARLYLRSSAPGIARIYSIGGVLVGEVNLPTAGETVSFPLNPGFYVVTMNGKVYKIATN